MVTLSRKCSYCYRIPGFDSQAFPPFEIVCKSENSFMKYSTKRYRLNKFIFFILSTFIYSQERFLPEQPLSIQESATFVSFNNSVKLSFDHTTLYKNGDAIYEFSTGFHSNCKRW